MPEPRVAEPGHHCQCCRSGKQQPGAATGNGCGGCGRRRNRAGDGLERAGLGQAAGDAGILQARLQVQPAAHLLQIGCQFGTGLVSLLDAFGEDLPTTTVVTWNGSETEMKTIGGDELTRWVERGTSYARSLPPKR